MAGDKHEKKGRRAMGVIRASYAKKTSRSMLEGASFFFLILAHSVYKM
jgi:hypothetical protein